MAVTGKAAGRPNKVAGAKPAQLTEEDLSKIPPFPEGLNEDGEAMWVTIWGQAAEWLNPVDRFIITELCQIYQDKELYRRSLELNAVPRTYRLSNKTIVPHPYVGMLKEARAQMNSHFASLGFSPADRAKIGAIESLVDDPIVEMVKAKARREEERQKRHEEREAAHG